MLGFDAKPSAHTDVVASLIDRDQVARAATGVDHVLHTATLHKPHLASHSRQDFIDVNVAGTLGVLEASLRPRCAASCSPRAPARSVAR